MEDIEEKDFGSQVNQSRTLALIVGLSLAVIGLLQGYLGSGQWAGASTELYVDVYASICTSILAIYWLVKDSLYRGNLVSNSWVVFAAFFTTITLLVYAFEFRKAKFRFVLVGKYFLCLVVYTVFIIAGMLASGNI